MEEIQDHPIYNKLKYVKHKKKNYVGILKRKQDINQPVFPNHTLF